MKKIINILICGAIAAYSLPTAVFAEEIKPADGTVVSISTAAEFVDFSKKCNIDSYSKGKQFVLTDDIELTHSGFETVPYFAGSFNGGGHTISGLRLITDGSVKGLFRYCAEGARITDLNVKGRVLPGGTGCSVGGIVGENSGELVRCSFDGKTAGIKCVGGITGVNTETGIINSCTFSGDTEGEHRVGGIAGENRGIITSCTNSANVNTHEIEVRSEKNLGINILSDIKDIKKDVSDTSEENFQNISDIGGITGLSAGIAEKCVNTGKVGYEHMGYNVGGIAGRSSGRLASCENKGTVFGRKDVGGVAGQIEPFSCWDFSDSKVSDLEGDLGDLQSQINSMIDSGEVKSADAREQLKEINKELRLASEELKKLREQTSGDVSASEKSLKEMRKIVSEYLTGLSESAEELDKYAGEAKTAIGSIASDAASSVKTEINDKKKQAQDITDKASAVISKAADDTGLDEYSRLLSELSEKLRNDPNTEKTAELMELLKSTADDESRIHSAVREQCSLIREELQNGDIEGLIGSLEQLKGFKQEISDDTRYQRIFELMRELELPKNDISAFEKYISDMKYRADCLEADIDELAEVLSHTKELFNVKEPELDVSQLTEIIDKMYKNIGDEKNREKELAAQLKTAASGLMVSVPDTNELITHLRKAGEGASKLADKALNDNNLVTDINSIRDSFEQMIGRVSGTVEDVATVRTQFESDVSDEGEKSLNGTIKECSSTADISGDNNVGGIAGSMSFEIEFDAEDKLNVSQYMLSDARFLIYTVIDGCNACGDILAKKESAGGIVGNMDFGMVKNCVSSGLVKVTNGDNCGGTAGKSLGTIKSCCSRTVLDGGKYVGGIAGYGSSIEDCLVYSFIDSSKEYAGSAAGYTEKEVKGCYFVDNGIGGIDGVSKAGVAEPVSYKDMIKKKGVPEVFKKITVTFIANGEEVAEVEVPFGGKLSRSDIPEVERQGVKYWKWDDIGTDEIYYSIVLHGKYVDPLGTIATEGDIPQFLAEGTFYEGQTLSAEPTPENEGDTASYRITVDGSTTPLKIRFRSDIKDGELLVNSLSRNYERDGSYIVFELENGGSFVYRPVEKDYGKYIIAGVSAGTACIITAIAAVIIAKKRAKRRPRSPSK